MKYHGSNTRLIFIKLCTVNFPRFISPDPFHSQGPRAQRNLTQQKRKKQFTYHVILYILNQLKLVWFLSCLDSFQSEESEEYIGAIFRKITRKLQKMKFCILHDYFFYYNTIFRTTKGVDLACFKLPFKIEKNFDCPLKHFLLL